MPIALPHLVATWSNMGLALLPVRCVVSKITTHFLQSALCAITVRNYAGQNANDSDSKDEDERQGEKQQQEQQEQQEQQQYLWHAYSPKILINLAPAIRSRSMFPAILCGKCAIDKNVVTLLSDRINAVSMNKVQRPVQQGHDEWYTGRRDLYQTLLYQAYTASRASSQRGILSFVKPSGSYTPHSLRLLFLLPVCCGEHTC